MGLWVERDSRSVGQAQWVRGLSVVGFGDWWSGLMVVVLVVFMVVWV